MLPALLAHGDTIVLDSGREFRGIVNSRTPSSIQLRTSAGLIELPLDRVVREEKDTPLENALLQAEFSLVGSKGEEAARHVAEAMAAGLSTTEFRRWLQKKAPIISMGLQNAPSAVRDNWRRLIFQASELSTDDSQTSPSLSADYLVAMAGLLDRIDEKDSALRMIEKLPALDLRIADAQQEWMRPLLMDRLEALLENQEFERALYLVEKMEAAKLGVGKPSRILLGLRWAAYERGRMNYDTALRILRKRVRPLSPALGQERMRTVLLEGRTNLTRLGRFQEALELYRDWGMQVLQKSTGDIRAEIYREWGHYLLENQEYDKAREAYDNYYRLHKGDMPEDGRPLIDRVTFQERFDHLEPHQYANAFELGEWAAKNKLPEQAIKAFQQAAGHSSLRDLAQEQIDTLQKNIALERLDACISYYEQGDPHRALEEMKKLDNYTEDPEIQKRMERLRRICSNELQRRNALRPVQAQTLYEDAKRRFMLGENQSVIQDLKIIIRQYEDTEVANMAAQLLEQVLLRVQMQKLEGKVDLPPESIPPPATESGIGPEVRDLIKSLQLDDGNTP
ncbi:MAG: hypothetical protein ACLFUS_16095 [Candidatus Sumerlaeia bacterium]